MKNTVFAVEAQKGGKMNNVILISTAMILLMVGCSGSKPPVKAQGVVTKVSVSFDTSGALMQNPSTSKEVLVLTLANSESAKYKVPISVLAEMQGFAQLKGQAGRGLAILHDLNQRLKGKLVDMTCSEVGKEDGEKIYSISELQVR